MPLPKFSDLLALVRGEPKTLDAARSALASTAPALDSVSALFTAAGLNLEQMLAAGPDSLKAHLAAFEAKDASLAEAMAKAGALEKQITDLRAEHTAALAKEATAHSVTAAALTAHAELFSAIGFTADPKATPEALKTAFAAHVEKAATARLAQAGVPPVAHGPEAGAAASAAASSSAPKLKGLKLVQANFRAESASRDSRRN